MASGATIPVAQSVTIPNKIVQITPTSTAPQITAIKDNGYLWRILASTRCRAVCSAQAAVGAFGRGATVNVGARNDAFGVALRKLFVAQYTKLGGKIGVQVSWNPTQATFDSEAGKLVDGNPKGFVMIDFPETFEKMAPALVRTGKWSPAKTLMTEAMRNADVLQKIGGPAVEGSAERRRPRRARPRGRVRPAVQAAREGCEGVHRLRGVRLRRGEPRVPRGGEGEVGESGPDQGAAPRGLRPPGLKVTYRQMDRAIKLLLSGGDVDYEGAWGPPTGTGTAIRARPSSRSGSTEAARSPPPGSSPSGVDAATTLQGRRRLRGSRRLLPCGAARRRDCGQRTAATGPDGAALHPGDTYSQTREAIERALAAAAELGAAREDVLRTRVYLVPDCEWEGAVRAHREAFAGVDPANTTLYVAGFIPPGVLVEVELDAVLTAPPR